MTKEERIKKHLEQEPGLAFIPDFLKHFPKAELFLVGGAVRDAMINRSMKELDFDFVIRGAKAQELHDWFEKRGHIDLVGRDFGVFKFMPDGFTTDNLQFIDIALPRTEAAHPDNVGGYKEFDIQSDPNLSIEDDLSRRDFTVNALAFDVKKGLLIDPFNGQRDLEQRIIRTVGDPKERFSEDMSRILRAMRFAAELQFEIETDTLAAVRTLAERVNNKRKRKEELEYIIPRETLGSELGKALERNPSGAVDWLIKTKLMLALFPEIQQVIDVDTAYLLPMHQLKEGCLMITTTLLLRAVEPNQVEPILARTGMNTLPRDSSRRLDIHMVHWIITRLHPPITPQDVEDMPAAEFEKYFFNNNGRHMLKILNFLGHAEVGVAARNRKQTIENRWLIEPGETIPPLLSGDDVLKAGIEQGPKVRKILEDCRSRQLSGELMTREAAKTWLTTRT
jgi:tRNA nucleotidyltransferase/poly(A) polymerase